MASPLNHLVSDFFGRTQGSRICLRNWLDGEKGACKDLQGTKATPIGGRYDLGGLLQRMEELIGNKKEGSPATQKRGDTPPRDF